MGDRRQQNQSNTLEHQLSERGNAHREGARHRQDVDTTWDSSRCPASRTGSTGCYVTNQTKSLRLKEEHQLWKVQEDP